MKQHKFDLGSRVQYRSPSRRDNVETSDYIVARLLPADAEGHQYRIQSRSDGHQRVVHESELSRSSSVF